MTDNEHRRVVTPTETERLSGDVARMGGMVEDRLRKATDALSKGDANACRALVAGDVEIDRLRSRIEIDTVNLLAMNNLGGRDLRHAVAALKISAELERIGDLCRNIVWRGSMIEVAAPAEWLKGVNRMGRLVAAQLKRVLDACSAGDIEAAARVWERDAEIDELYNSLFRELLAYVKNSGSVNAGAHFMFMLKNLERIGDHCTNIAETVRFVVTGDMPTDERPKRHEYAH